MRKYTAESGLALPAADPDTGDGDSDDERAGRWAGKAKTECGLHTFWQSKENQPQEGGDDAEEEAEKPS